MMDIDVGAINGQMKALRRWLKDTPPELQTAVIGLALHAAAKSGAKSISSPGHSRFGGTGKLRKTIRAQAGAGNRAEQRSIKKFLGKDEEVGAQIKFGDYRDGGSPHAHLIEYGRKPQIANSRKYRGRTRRVPGARAFRVLGRGLRFASQMYSVAASSARKELEKWERTGEPTRALRRRIERAVRRGA